MKTYTLPPREIYDLLHLAEAKGVEIPNAVDDWWHKETKIDQDKRVKKTNNWTRRFEKTSHGKCQTQEKNHA